LSLQVGAVGPVVVSAVIKVGEILHG
jgi:hypothetical protein